MRRPVFRIGPGSAAVRIHVPASHLSTGQALRRSSTLRAVEATPTQFPFMSLAVAIMAPLFARNGHFRAPARGWFGNKSPGQRRADNADKQNCGVDHVCRTDPSFVGATARHTRTERHRMARGGRPGRTPRRARRSCRGAHCATACAARSSAARCPARSPWSPPLWRHRRGSGCRTSPAAALLP